MSIHAFSVCKRCLYSSDRLWRTAVFAVCIIPALHIPGEIPCEETQTSRLNDVPWVMLLVSGWARITSEFLCNFHSFLTIAVFLGLIWFYWDKEILRRPRILPVENEEPYSGGTWCIQEKGAWDQGLFFGMRIRVVWRRGWASEEGLEYSFPLSSARVLPLMEILFQIKINQFLTFLCSWQRTICEPFYVLCNCSEDV